MLFFHSSSSSSSSSSIIYSRNNNPNNLIDIFYIIFTNRAIKRAIPTTFLTFFTRSISFRALPHQRRHYIRRPSLLSSHEKIKHGSNEVFYTEHIFIKILHYYIISITYTFGWYTLLFCFASPRFFSTALILLYFTTFYYTFWLISYIQLNGSLHNALCSTFYCLTILFDTVFPLGSDITFTSIERTCFARNSSMVNS